MTKKSKHGRKSVLSAKAKRRVEKGLDRAEAVMDKTETKIEISKNRARNVQERSKAWEELNRRALAEKARHEAVLLEVAKDSWADEDDLGFADSSGDRKEKKTKKKKTKAEVGAELQDIVSKISREVAIVAEDEMHEEIL